MGFRFHKSFKVAPGVRINISKKSAGLSFGKKGARVSLNTKGQKRATVGIPGTGLSYSTSLNNKKSTTEHSVTRGERSRNTSPKQTPIWPLLLGILFLISGVAAMHKDIGNAIFMVLIGGVLIYWNRQKVSRPHSFSKIQLLEWQRLVISDSEKLIYTKEQLEDLTNDDIKQRTRIINDCKKLITSTTNADTFFDRYRLLEEHSDFIECYKPYFDVSQYIPTDFLNAKERHVNSFIDRMWEKTIQKVNTLTTENGKNNQFVKFSTTINEHLTDMPAGSVDYYKNQYLNKLH